MGKTVPSLDPVPEAILERVQAFCLRERLLYKTARVLLAVSGGPDSLAALAILCRLRDQFPFEVVGCHFDHRLRPDGASERERVRNVCESLGVRCITGEGEVATLAKQETLSIESAARKMRYDFLAFAAAELKADSIATGHTASDQAETVLMHVLRGSGIRGLRGMLPSSPTPGSGAMRLIRPILVLTGEDTRNVCRVCGLDPLEDPSNEDRSLLRNRIRHETLPALRAINPSADTALVKVADHAREAFRSIERGAAGTMPLSRGPWGAIYDSHLLSALDPEARILVVERELSAASLTPEVNHTRITNLNQIIRTGHGRVSFGKGEVEVSAGLARIGRPQGEEPVGPVVLDVPGTTTVGGWRLRVRASDGDVTAAGTRVPISPEGALRARSLTPGDVVLTSSGWRKAKELYRTSRIPAWERRGAIAVVDRRGVLAVAGPGGWSMGGQPAILDPLYVDFSRVS